MAIHTSLGEDSVTWSDARQTRSVTCTHIYVTVVRRTLARNMTSATFITMPIHDWLAIYFVFTRLFVALSNPKAALSNIIIYFLDHARKGGKAILRMHR